MRKPKNLDQYVTRDVAALGLEQIAADLRKNDGPEILVKWSLNISRWDPSWEDKPKSASPETQDTP